MNNNNRKVLRSFDEKTTRFLSNVYLLCIVFFAAVLALNEIGVFIIENKPAFRLIVLAEAVILAVPRIALTVRKRYEPWMKYCTVMCGTVAVCLAYSVLTFHVVMALTIPVVIAIMYFDNRLTVFTTVETAVCIALAHLLSSVILAVQDDPLQDMHAILVFGLLPRLMIFAVYAIIGIYLGEKSHEIFADLDETLDEINRTKDSLDTIIDVSRRLYGAMDMLELAQIVKYAIYTVTTKVQGNSVIPMITMGVKTENGVFHYIDDDLTPGLAAVEGDALTVELPNIEFTYPLRRQRVWDDIQIRTKGIGMTFYQDDELLFYVAMEYPVTNEDELLKSSLSILYSNINTAMRQTKVNSDIFKTQESVILSFAEISESKSQQTGQHVKRVSEYVRVMAAGAGYDDDQCAQIALAAMMHDIGKLMIPPEILEKPGRLTPEEFEVIKTHVTIGEELLRNSPGEVMAMARRIALQHHERWDGKGYLGYSGEKIDYLARFVSVADVFDALVSKRSYKDGWPPEEAYAEIIRQRGKQFAPHAVDIFVKSYDKILEILKRYPDQVAQVERLDSQSHPQG